LLVGKDILDNNRLEDRQKLRRKGTDIVLDDKLSDKKKWNIEKHEKEDRQPAIR
jgi:hypothetical protein